MAEITQQIQDVVDIDPDTQWLTVHYEDMYFEDTDLLSPAANYYRENGYYCPYDRKINKQQWLDFWKEEQRRCRKGYTAENGIQITGYHYFYLNYCPIQIITEEEDAEGEIIASRHKDFPRFYDGDFLFFHIVELARKMNKHLVVLKARRKGYSYKCASMLACNYYHKRDTKNYVFTSIEKYLNEDGILSPKCWNYLSFIDEHTGWFQARQVKDQDLHKRASHKYKKNGNDIEKGLMNEIIGVTLKDDPDKIRGKAGEIMLYEEMGKFPELLDAWQIAYPTVKQGSKTVGLMLGFGTGGTEDANFESAEELFYNPEPYDILAFNNIWDEGARGSECGYFVPNYLNLDGFIDEHGNSQVMQAKAFAQSERQKKKKANSSKSYERYVAEHAETPNEATLQTEANLFPVQELNEQYNHVRATKKHKILTHGTLIETSNGVKFRIQEEANPIMNFPHTKNDDVSGCVSILESPIPVGGDVPSGMYYVCHDPYAHDSSTNRESLGAAYVIKRTNNISMTYNECIVASYVGRPDRQDDYNYMLFLLAEYYNAKIGFENDRGDVIGYAKRFKKLGFLQEEFEMLHKKELQSKAVNRPYGMHMTPQRKEQGELYIRDWLNTKVRTNDGDGEVKVLHTIYDLALLKELIKYNKKGNFDRVMSLMVGMYQGKELYNKQVQTGPPRNPEHEEWMNNHYRQELIHR